MLPFLCSNIFHFSRVPGKRLKEACTKLEKETILQEYTTDLKNGRIITQAKIILLSLYRKLAILIYFGHD